MISNALLSDLCAVPSPFDGNNVARLAHAASYQTADEKAYSWVRGRAPFHAPHSKQAWGYEAAPSSWDNEGMD